jgi:hypothetical protein
MVGCFQEKLEKQPVKKFPQLENFGTHFMLESPALMQI